MTPGGTGGLRLGVDLGGSKLRAALADDRGTILAEMVEPTVAGPAETVGQQVALACRALTARLGVAPHDVRAAGIGLPVAIHPSTGQAWSTANLGGLRGAAPRTLLERALGMPVAVDNDANCAALAEGRRGAAVGEADYAVVAIGTGVGAGIVSGGRLLRGARGGAGELAFLPLGTDPWGPGSREAGAYERAVSGPAVVARVDEALSRGEATLLPPGSQLTAIAAAAADGDALARRLLDAEARLVALGIAVLSVVVDPRLVVLSGGVGAVAGLLPVVTTHVTALCAQPPRIVTSVLGERAPLVGSLLLAAELGRA